MFEVTVNGVNSNCLKKAVCKLRHTSCGNNIKTYSGREVKKMEMWFSEFHTPDVKHSIRVNRQLYSKQSDISELIFLRHRNLAGSYTGRKCNAHGT